MSKNLLTYLGEAIDRYHADRAALAAQESPMASQPAHISKFLRLPNLPRNLRSWLPSRGNALFTIILVISLVWAGRAGALSPGIPASSGPSTGSIAYQGRLANTSGSPLTGTYSMIFRLYSAATGSVPLWTEQWTGPNSVQVSDGLFNVMLGSIEPIQQSVITGNNSLWLGITVGTDDEMAPRVQLGSVPFAVQALTVADGSITTEKLADGSVTGAKVMDGSITAVKIANGAIGNTKLADGSITTDKIADGAVTSNKLADNLALNGNLDVKNGRIAFYNGPETGDAGFGQLLCNAADNSSCDFYTGYGHGGLIMIHEWHGNGASEHGQKLYMFTAHSTDTPWLTLISSHGSNNCSISHIRVWAAYLGDTGPFPVGEWSHQWRMANNHSPNSGGCAAYYIRVH
jgi:hypothetical protein